MKTIYLQTLTSEKIALFLENQTLQTVSVERPGQNHLVGNIYLARIRNVDKRMQAAFVDFGEKKNGFLPAKQVPGNGGKIEELLHEGQTLWVQVIKEPYENKGARLTANITLPGKYFVYMPFGGYIAVSKKLSPNDRIQFRQQIASWCMDEEGAIVRTSALSASDAELKKEWERLKLVWNGIKEKKSSVKVPACVFEDREIPDRFLQKMGEEADEIIVDDVEVAQSIKEKYPEWSERIRWGGRNEKKTWVDVSQLFQQLTSRELKLSSGAEIIIENTRAFTVIDVNSASYRGGGGRDQTILSVNMEAAERIMKEIRLRNISGMILIDFIDMKSREARDKLLHYMEELCKKDSVYADVHGFTKLGILEMTRKREGLDIYSLLCQSEAEPEWSLETHAYQLERELLQYRRGEQEVILVEIQPDMYQKFIHTIDVNRLKNLLNYHVYIRTTPSIDRPYVLKYVGEESWLKREYSSIDKLL
ncbi:MAG: Rne/Rng family ribonuclease [Bacillaceae bacterium]|nr:Rne/Rng family ribonuclease [Bacillaceae bacterium]